MSRGRRPRPRRTWPQRLVIGLNIVIVLSALGSAAVLAYTKETVSSIPRVAIGALAPDEVSGSGSADGGDAAGNGDDESEPVLNFLLVGVDNVDGLPSDHILKQTRAATQLTDTMVVFRVDPNTGTAAVLSVPRDLWVPINGAGQDKINAALALGGPEALVTSIQDALGIPIHRYVQVNFAGFLELMRVIGGINVIIDSPVRDVKAQLDIQRTGCVTLTPNEALSYVRSRSLQSVVNGNWTTIDGRGDLGRIDRQQDFMIIALNQAFSRGLSDPTVLKGILDDVLGGEHITLDSGITPQELLDLADAFRSFDDDDIERHTLPVTLGSAGARSVVFLNEDEAQEALAAFRGPGAQARLFRLAVRNGTVAAGLASEVGYVLGLDGFNVVEATNADRFDYVATTIRFDSSQRLNALELERWLENGAVLQQRDVDTGAPVELIVGADYTGLLDIPRDPVEPTPSLTGEQLAAGEVHGNEEVEITDTPAASPTPTPTPAAMATIRGC